MFHTYVEGIIKQSAALHTKQCPCCIKSSIRRDRLEAQLSEICHDIGSIT